MFEGSRRRRSFSSKATCAIRLTDVLQTASTQCDAAVAPPILHMTVHVEGALNTAVRMHENDEFMRL